MKRTTIIGAFAALALCASAATVITGCNTLGGGGAADTVATVRLDATKGVYAAEATVDAATVAATMAARNGVLKGPNAAKAGELNDKAHAAIGAAHAALTLGKTADAAAKAQEAIGEAFDLQTLANGGAPPK